MTAFAKGFRDSGGCERQCKSSSRDSRTASGAGSGSYSAISDSSSGDKVMRKSVSVQVDSIFGYHLQEGVYEIKRMEPRSSRLRSVILICLVLAVSGIIGFGYFCNDQVRESVLDWIRPLVIADGVHGEGGGQTRHLVLFIAQGFGERRLQRGYRVVVVIGGDYWCRCHTREEISWPKKEMNPKSMKSQ